MTTGPGSGNGLSTSGGGAHRVVQNRNINPGQHTRSLGVAVEETAHLLLHTSDERLVFFLEVGDAVFSRRLHLLPALFAQRLAGRFVRRLDGCGFGLDLRDRLLQ